MFDSDNSVHVNIGISGFTGSWYWYYHRVNIYSNPFMEHFNVVDIESYLESWGGPVIHTYNNSPQQQYLGTTTNFNPFYAKYRYRNTSTGATTVWKNAAGSRTGF